MALSGKNFSSFLTTCSQDLAAIFCAHALTESVILFALAIVRIERWFHYVYTSAFTDILSHYKKICPKSQAGVEFHYQGKYPHKNISRHSTTPVDIILSTKT